MNIYKILIAMFVAALLTACGGGAGGDSGASTLGGASGTGGSGGTGATTPLFTTAPSALTLSAGQTSESFAITGGKSPYTVVASNPALFTVTYLGAAFNVTGISDGAGSVAVKDAAGAEVSLVITVSAPLFTTAPSTLVLRPDDTTVSYTITGGKAPYTVATSNPATATVALIGAAFKITGVGDGASSVVVKDAAGAEVLVAITVSAPLFTTAPAAVALKSGETTLTFNISGGRAPYTVLSSNVSAVNIASVSGNKFKIMGASNGSATVYVTDTLGAQVIVRVNVVAPLFSTAPSTLILPAGTTSEAYTVSGGQAPYTVTSANPSVVAATLFENKFTIIAVKDGSADVVLIDAAGTQMLVNVMVSASSAAFFTTAPAEVTLRSAGTSDGYAVGGGKAPYSVVSSNTAVASVVVSGSNFNIVGVADGAAVVSAKDAVGTQVVIKVTVSTNTAALFTTAPSALTLRAGATSTVYPISGGKAPYSLSSANATVASADLSGSSAFVITGATDGSTAVFVKDAAGAQVLINVTVSSSTGTLFTTAPNALTLPASITSDSYTITGGVAPYTVSSSGPAVAAVSQSGRTFTIKGLADGSAVVTIKDSMGTQVAVNVTVSSQLAALFTTAPASLTLRAGVASAGYAISGGQAPYAVVTSNSAVASVAVSGSSGFVISGVGDGIAAVYVKDAVGVQVLINVTVATSAGPFFTTAPAALTLQAPSTSESYSITGGIAPYAVTTSNPVVATVARSGNSFTVTSVNGGGAIIHIKDAVGAEIQVAFTAVNNATSLFTSAPAVLTVAVGGTSDEYTISGGRAPYSVSSGNAAVATVGINGSRFVMNGLVGGSATVTIKDSVGTSLTLNLSVGSTTALFVTATPQVNIATGVTRTYVVAGGAAPYATSTSDSSVATVLVSGNSLAITAVKPGTANIVVRDTLNGTVTITVSVPSGATPVPTALFTTSPGRITVAPGSTPTFTIGGGTAPYIAQTNDATVVGLTITAGNTLAIFGTRLGSAKVVVTDMVGAQVSIDVTVGSGAVVALYTTAPSGLIIASGASRDVSIGGGVGPFQVISNDTSIVAATVSGSTITVIGTGAGVASVTVFDAEGRAVTFAVNVPTTSALFTTAPSVLSAAALSSRSFTIGGGTAPYTATSNNSGVAVASVAAGTTLQIDAQAVGSAQVIIRDAAGATVQLQVAVTTAAFATTAPSSLTLAIGAPPNQYSVTGGTAPYTATSSNTAVATVSAVSTGLFTATGVTPGAAQILIRDAAGASINVSVTVSTIQALAVPAPSKILLPPSGVALYPIIGGFAPYFVVTGDASVATAGVSGSSLTVTGVGPGLTQVMVRDSLGSTVSLTVTVGALPALYTSATATVTIARGGLATYTVGGGAGSYVASSSNQAVATVLLTGGSLQVNGLSLGSATVQVRDAAGALVSIAVTVGPGLALSTTAPASITVLPRALSYDYQIIGGTSPYSVASSNEVLVTATTTLGSSTLKITGIAAGMAVVLVSDALGATQSINVTVTPAASSPLTVTPSAVTASVGDSLNFVVAGGDPGTSPAVPYTVTVQNTSLMTATPTSTDGGLTTFRATLTNTGATSVIVGDSKGQKQVVTVTITNNQPLLRLSPSMVEIGENFNGNINFYVSGGEGLLTAYTDNLKLSSVPAPLFPVAVSPAISVAVPIGLGTNGNRCVQILDSSIPDDFVDVSITVVDDKTGRSATSVLRIKDNRGTCP